MKKFLLLLLICFAQNSFSQNTKKDNVLVIDEPTKTPPPQGSNPNEDNSIYNTAGIDIRPEFPGGVTAMNSFITQNFKSPKEGLKGKIYATFIIEKDGSLNDIKILRDLGYETGKEAIRVLKLFPKWSPGQQKNKTVRVLYSIPMIIN
ncbi:energy transducer TonB [Flavobacterium anhuiense]|jgi:protein TonB|uniref:energy transducer TonB n=1 Tax=Flavobacterium anhuiense TaxID=459526 RepID=UPI000E6D12D8|nr:energy transducer TonB [Flavobacterium anhuiense]